MGCRPPEVATDRPGLMLRQQTGTDCDAYYELITLKRDHLRRYGDCRQESNATRDWVVAYFAEPQPTTSGSVSGSAPADRAGSPEPSEPAAFQRQPDYGQRVKPRGSRISRGQPDKTRG